MQPFDYFQPADLKEALQLLRQFREKAKVLAGGTDLVLLFKAWKIQIDAVIDINNLRELNFIEESNFLRIGPLTTHATLSKSPLIRQKFTALAQATDKAGPVQIKNLGTVGGNIISAGRCADTVPALLCHDASLTLTSEQGERTVSLRGFILKPRRTVLRDDELLTAISILQPPPRTGSAFMKLGRRLGHDFSIANAAARVTLEGDVCKEVRIAVGASVPVPTRCVKAESILVSRELSGKNIAEAATTVASEISPISDFRASRDYRREVSRVLVKRVLEEVKSQLGG